MRILILTTHFLPELTGNAPLLGELCEDLVSRGHQVTVLAGPAAHNTSPLDGRYRRLGLCRELLAGVPVVRVNGLSFGGSRWVNRLFVLVWFPIVACWVGLFMGRCDVILCPSPPLWLGLAARLLGWAHRVPYVYVVQDLWPDAPILLGLVRNRGLVYLLRAIEQIVYRGARRVIAINAAMGERLLELGVSRTKLEIIQNWVDADLFSSGAVPRPGPLRRQIGAGAEDTVVLHSGNMGRSHPVDLVVEAAGILRQRERLRFAFVGAGMGLRSAHEVAARMRLSNVHFLPFQPRQQLASVLGDADIAVVTLRAGMGAFSLPSRMYMLMAAGLPIVGSFDANSGAAILLRDAGAGILVRPDSSGALAEALEVLADQPSLRRRLGQAGRAYVAQQCRREVATGRYEAVLLEATEPISPRAS